MKDIVEAIVRSIVQQPDSIKVIEEVVEGKSSIKISVAQPDMGRIIGKEGRNINAIRTLVAAMAAKDDKRITVDILEG